MDSLRQSGQQGRKSNSRLSVISLSAASRENHVKFGDCAVRASRQLSFTLTNHSTSDPVRFTWSPPPEITFSPCVGHLQPNCAKDVTVTFCSKEPKTYSGTNVPCKVTKIKLGEAQDKVSFLGSLSQIKNLFSSYSPCCVQEEGCRYVYSVNLCLSLSDFSTLLPLSLSQNEENLLYFLLLNQHLFALVSG